MRSWVGWLFFLLVFLSLYGGAHALVFFKLKGIWGLQGKWIWLLLAGIVLLVLAPFGERVLDRLGIETSARVVAYVGYVWMGMLFFLLTTYGCASLVRGILVVLGKALPTTVGSIHVTDGSAFGLALVVATVITVYGHFEAGFIRTEHVVLPVTTVTSNVSTLKIAQISDVHLGLINRDAKLKKIAAIIEREQPDLLVSTGDLVDGEITHLETLGNYLGALHPRLGKFAVMGNHEFYAGLEQALKFTRAAGFVVLRNEAVSLPGLLNIAGVDDPAVHMMSSQPRPSEVEIMGLLPKDQLTLLLKHQPRIDKAAQGLFHLQLSGHTHQGQIYPFVYLTHLAYPIGDGLRALGKEQWIYVSRGTGTWGPPLRFLAPPEVTIIEVEFKSN